MWLNIYLGTIAVSLATKLTISIACYQKLKRNGYKFVKQERTFKQKVVKFISTFAPELILGVNILSAAKIMRVADKFYDYAEAKLLKQGKIYKPVEEKINSDFEKESSNLEEVKIHTGSVQKTKTEKTYDEITTEEKLAYLKQERENLINHFTTQTDKSPVLNKRR